MKFPGENSIRIQYFIEVLFRQNGGLFPCNIPVDIPEMFSVISNGCSTTILYGCFLVLPDLFSKRGVHHCCLNNQLIGGVGIGVKPLQFFVGGNMSVNIFYTILYCV
ncbi:hypothetical protein GA0116948_10189 [Chitinophaga costaii]|uniref:Uncharacterized protein n=1 Tax=Chitinophaga costaii TaxID=1335309 RepID=A0A1C3YSX2_9BACT|nr:hypothetical protein DCM91_01025 [Chitinophaga costaii]SCB73128.1 hypothetical protein GA0116948_10189 [Chitinophaga costaii]